MIICATGHRPLYGTNYAPAKKRLAEFFDLNFKNIDYCISGMADGWDTIFARCTKHYKVPLKCCIPFKNQKPTSDFYQELLDYSFEVVYTSDIYYKRVFLDRDEQMVNECDFVIAFWNPDIKNGGTFYTINYAKKQNKPIINLFL